MAIRNGELIQAGNLHLRKLIKLQQQIVGEVLHRNVYLGMFLPVREPPPNPPAWAAQFVGGHVAAMPLAALVPLGIIVVAFTVTGALSIRRRPAPSIR